MASKTSIKVGDEVRVVVPRYVERVGYPKAARDYQDLVLERDGAVIDRIVMNAANYYSDKAHAIKCRIIDDLCYLEAHKNGFGGTSRTLHFNALPHGNVNSTYFVTRKRRVTTGTYIKGDAGSRGSGVYKDEDTMSKLVDTHTHTLVEGLYLDPIAGNGLFIKTKNVWMLIDDVELVRKS
jgi:hypothetical protein